jgi:small G protein signaling modulator 3
MASTSQPANLTSHPLYIDETPTKGRKSRADRDPDAVSLPPNYFTLKAQLQRTSEFLSTSASREGSVRSRSTEDVKKAIEHRAHLSHAVATSSGELPDDVPQSRKPELIIPDTYSPFCSSQLASFILSTHWHQSSDEEIESTIFRSNDAVEFPEDTSDYPYHTALRVLSLAFNNSQLLQAELEDCLERLQKELIQIKERRLMKDSEQSEQDIPGRGVKTLFSEEEPPRSPLKGHRHRSFMVRSLICMLKPSSC